jgi:hypothetical protein
MKAPEIKIIKHELGESGFEVGRAFGSPITSSQFLASNKLVGQA